MSIEGPPSKIQESPNINRDLCEVSEEKGSKDWIKEAQKKTPNKGHTRRGSASEAKSSRSK
jgi:hypothetical protein